MVPSHGLDFAPRRSSSILILHRHNEIKLAHDTDSSRGVMKSQFSTARDVPRVLFWPQSCGSQPGFVLGWQTTTKWSHQIVVAGVVQRDDRIKEKQQYESIRKATRKLIACCCCTCGQTDSTYADAETLCSGCTRQRLEGIEIVAYYDPLGVNGQKTLINDLPVISNARGVPFWIEDVHGAAGQLVYYRNAGERTGYIRYRYVKAFSNDSFLSTRLEYASSMMRDIEWLLVGTGGEVSISRNAPPPMSSSDSGTETGKLTFLSYAARYSLCCQLLNNSWKNLPISFLLAANVKRLKRVPNTQMRGCCHRCRKMNSIPTTHDDQVHDRIQATNNLTRLFVEVLVGYMVGYFVSRHISDWGLIHSIIGWHYTMLRHSVMWLNSFPVGFKLNERLTAVLSEHICSLLSLHENVSSRTLGLLIQAQNPVLIQALCTNLGGSLLLAIVFDLVQLASSHLLLLRILFGKVYMAEMSLLTALWCLFRGKKRNILRRRTDSMEYDSTQLLFGTIVFVVALFLFTTVLVYHFFFATAHLIVTLCLLSIQMSSTVIHFFPYGMLYQRTVTAWFTINGFLSYDKDMSSDMLDVTTLHVVATSYISIVKGGLSAKLVPIGFHLLLAFRSVFTGAPVNVYPSAVCA